MTTTQRIRKEKNIRLKPEVYDRLKKKAWTDRVTISECISVLLDNSKKKVAK